MNLMNEQWKAAALGGVIGAALSLAVVFTAGWFGLLPGTGDARLHAYLVAHPYLLVEMTDKLQKSEADKEQQGRQAAIDKVGLKRFFDPSVAYVTGPANAKNTFVEFFDYNCIHCRNSFAAVKKFYDTHKSDTRFAFIVEFDDAHLKNGLQRIEIDVDAGVVDVKDAGS